MHITSRLPLLAAATLLAAAPAVAQQSTQAAPAMMAGMDKMQHDMSSAPMTGNPDADFVAMMIPHHRGAVEMAQVELQYGKDPAIRELATAIIAAQNKELEQMKTWQTQHPAR